MMILLQVSNTIHKSLFLWVGIHPLILQQQIDYVSHDFIPWSYNSWIDTPQIKERLYSHTPNYFFHTFLIF